jgi:tetratricopeptide (TPR) repeat protein
MRRWWRRCPWCFENSRHRIPIVAMRIVARDFVILGICLNEFPLANRALNLELSIAAYEAALRIYTREAAPENWAGIQNNLGLAYGDRIRGERAENLEQAITAYESALQVYTREVFPVGWAMTQNNLGTCLRRSHSRGAGRESGAGDRRL